MTPIEASMISIEKEARTNSFFKIEKRTTKFEAGNSVGPSKLLFPF